MNVYDLHTILPEIGRVTIRGREDGSYLVFDHPKDEGSIVLAVTMDRANELASISPHESRRLNLRIERHEIHMGREHHREALKTIQCPHCYAPITWIDTDFLLHSIPWCRVWRATHPKG